MDKQVKVRPYLKVKQHWMVLDNGYQLTLALNHFLANITAWHCNTIRWEMQ